MDNPYTQADADTLQMSRFIFDNLFNLILNIIMINIIAGIIIDSFARLRDEDEKLTKDMKDNCLVCSVNRNELDKASVSNYQDHRFGYLYHVKNVHYLWNYVFYISSILDKPVSEFTGVESYVAAKLLINDVSWFPLNFK